MEKEPVIEKGIPMPARKGAMLSIAAAVKKMEVGDSMVVTGLQYGAARVYAHRVGVKLTFRKIDNTSHRAWRIA